jgi:beta-galactosidase
VIYKKYGYSDFFVDISEYVNENENVIKVIVDNDNQPNSRWYTGSGIYKDVNLYILEKEHIILNSTKVKTVDYKNRIVNLSLNTSVIVNVEVLFKHNELCKKIIKKSQGELSFDVELSDFPLWDENSPNLITCIIKFKNDEHIIRFGIREIKLDKEKGLLINGNRVILKGACIHHDNGFLGAVSNRFAEYRKVKLLKDAGYNAIRSAHNPISKHILNACDELGMYILDEYVDMWYIHKTQYDYASYVEDNYQTDLLEMITKDYNHPSCIMYSLRNEVAETSEK